MADLTCECCNAPIATPEGEPHLCRVCWEEGYIPEADLARGRAGFIVTAPGENIIERVEAERQANLERFSNDMKGCG